MYDIALYFKNKLLKEAEGQLYFQKFNETATSQVKKQYNRYPTYYSQADKGVVTMYSESLYIRHCPAKILVAYFYEVTNIPQNLLLNVVMDGPNGNLAFLRELSNELETKFDGKKCPLEVVPLILATMLLENWLQTSLILLISINVPLICTFFKHSAARRLDYGKTQELSIVTRKHMIRHVETR